MARQFESLTRAGVKTRTVKRKATRKVIRQLCRTLNNTSRPKAKQLSPPKAKKPSSPKAKQLSPPKAKQPSRPKTKQPSRPKAKQPTRPKTKQATRPKARQLTRRNISQHWNRSRILAGSYRLREKKPVYYHETSNETAKLGFDLKYREQVLAGRTRTKLALVLRGEELTLAYINRNNFNQPILVKKYSFKGLNMKVPAGKFEMKDILKHVDPKRMLDVLNSSTQENEKWTFAKMVRYFKKHNIQNKDKTKRLIKYSSLSMEVSETTFNEIIKMPDVVEQLDWVHRAWPSHLFKGKTYFPKVQKYIIMSVEDCYTDFHVDFGGSSVCYHVKSGEKHFYLVKPTEANMEKLLSWNSSENQKARFFLDEVDQFDYVKVKAGDTLFLPAGWIHAVETKQPTIVIGGNFLHTFGVENQFAVWRMENLMEVSDPCRFPNFIELHWYVLARYVHCLLGRSHLNVDEDGTEVCPTRGGGKRAREEASKVQLSQLEIEGLEMIIDQLNLIKVSAEPKVPAEITSSEKLLKDGAELVKKQKKMLVTSADKGITNIPKLTWKSEVAVKKAKKVKKTA